MAGGKDSGTLGRPEAAGATLRDEGRRLASFASGMSRESDRVIGSSGDEARRASRRGAPEAARRAEAAGEHSFLAAGETPAEAPREEPGPLPARRRDVAPLTAASRAAKDVSGGAARGLAEAVEEKVGLRPADERASSSLAPASSGAPSLSDATIKKRTALQKATYAAKRGAADRVNDELTAAVRGDRESTLYAASGENRALSFLSAAGDGGVARVSRTVKRFRSGKARLSDLKADKGAAQAAGRLMAADRERLRQAEASSASDEIKEKLKKRASRRVTDYIRSTMSAGGTVTGHGLGMRAASGLRALATTTARGIARGVSAIAGVVGPWLVPIAAALVLFILIFSGGWAGGGSGDHGALTGVEAQVYDSLTGYGFSDEAIAGVLGNMKAESGMDPTVDADDGFGTVSMGLMQMVGAERVNFMSWCESKGYSWSTVAAQMEWTFSGESGTSSYEERWMFPGRVGDSYTSCPGYEDYFGSSWYKTGEEYKASSDVKLAAFSWMACYEGCATGQVSHLDNRISYAQEYLEQIKQGSGSSGSGSSSAASSDFVSRAMAVVGSNYTSSGYIWTGQTSSSYFTCSGLVDYAAGLPTNSNWPEKLYAEVSGLKQDVSSLSYGDLVFYSYAGRNPGHVGIYIGDGKIVDAEPGGGVQVRDVNSPGTFLGGGSWGGFGGDGNRQAAIDAAKALLGESYTHNNSVGAGFDCNGLCWYAWGQAGVEIPLPSGHYTDAGQFQYIKGSGNWVTSESDLQPGDLVFYSNDGGSSIFHVAMYIGDGQVIQSSEGTGVTIESLYWCSGFCGGGSPPGASGSASVKKTPGWSWWVS